MLPDKVLALTRLKMSYQAPFVFLKNFPPKQKIFIYLRNFLK